MTAPVPDGLEPLAVWEWRTIRDFTPEQHVEMCRWHERHIGRLNDTRRVEFCLLDAAFAVVHRYRRNAGGCKYRDPETGEPAVEPPVLVPLAELPPAHLLGR